jgi:hypothetical protein
MKFVANIVIFTTDKTITKLNYSRKNIFRIIVLLFSKFIYFCIRI